MIVRNIKILVRIILWLTILFLLLLAGLIIYATYSDYTPPLKQELKLYNNVSCLDSGKTSLTLLSWNIGYCGLGSEADFFYDGGKMSRPPKVLFQKYLNGVMRFLQSNDSIDIMFLQEVDSNSRRSYFTDQLHLINEVLPDYQFCFAKNYDVKFVPTPFLNPMGKVIAGMMTLSKVSMNEAWRYSYKSNASWPKNVFLLDRCLILSRIKLKNGKSLVLINTHNSAYDDAAEIREMEAEILKKIMLDEYSKGNYVIAGGDWNRNPPGFNINHLVSDEAHRFCSPSVPKDFLPKEWLWVFQEDMPTNRDVNSYYQKGKTKTTIIDYFVLSPNIKLKARKTIPTGFEFSDHQPVLICIELMNSITETGD